MPSDNTIEVAPALRCTPDGRDLNDNPLTPCAYTTLAPAPRPVEPAHEIGHTCLVVSCTLALLAYRAIRSFELRPEQIDRRNRARRAYRKHRWREYRRRRWYTRDD